MTQVSLSVSDRFGILARSAPLALGIESAPKATRPALIELRQSHRRWREGRELAQISSLAARRTERHVPLGTSFTFTLDRGARVSLVFALRPKGREGKRLRKAGILTFAAHPGKNRVEFQGRISLHKRLGPGRYRMSASARSEGLRSKPMSVTFTIVR